MSFVFILSNFIFTILDDYGISTLQQLLNLLSINLIHHLIYVGLQQIENPCPRVKHPVWLQRNMNEKVRVCVRTFMSAYIRTYIRTYVRFLWSQER
jgi:hypothetical protein